MKNKGTKQKTKKKGSENAFGCDLIEHLQNSGQDGKLFSFFLKIASLKSNSTLPELLPNLRLFLLTSTSHTDRG